MNILFVESDQVQEYNCSLWRVVFPARSLRRAGYKVETVRIEDWQNFNEPYSKDADLIIVQRNLFAGVLNTVLYWRAMGKKVVVDLDDAYAFMTEDTGSPSYSFWRLGRVQAEGGYRELNPRPLQMLEWGVKLCDGVTSPSKVICQDWSPLNKTYWFPNFIDHELYKMTDVYKPKGNIYFGWGGSMTHLVSWSKSGIGKALAMVIREYPNVHLIIIGDDRVHKAVPVPPGHKVKFDWVPHAIFSRVLSRFDVGLAPLYGEYDRRRSWLKSLEFTTMGIPWIGSDMEPNQEIPTGRLVNNTVDGWYDALVEYVKNISEKKEQAQSNIPLGIERSVWNNASTLMSLFERILNETI